MKNRLKRGLTLLLAVLLLVSSASCSSGLSLFGNEIDNSDDGQPVTVLVPIGTGIAEVIERMTTAYKKATGESIVVEKIPQNDYDETVANRLAAGTGPDILFFNSEANGSHGVYSYIKNEYLADLGPFMKNDKNYKAENFVPEVMEGGKVGQYQFVFPTSYDITQVYGLTPFGDQYGAPDGTETTPEEFLGKLTAMQDMVTAGTLKRVFLDGISTSFLYTAAHGYVDLLNKQIMLDSENARTALYLAYQNYMSDAQMSLIYSQNTDTDSSYFDFLLQGDGVLLSGQGAGYAVYLTLSAASINGQSLVISGIPSDKGEGRFDALITSGVGLNSASGHKAKAYKFLSYCVNNDEFYWSRFGGSGVSPKISVLEQSFTYRDEGNGNMIETIKLYYGEKAAQQLLDPAWQQSMRDMLQGHIGNVYMTDEYIRTFVQKTIANKSIENLDTDGLVNKIKLAITEYMGY